MFPLEQNNSCHLCCSSMPQMPPMERKFCDCLIKYMLQNHFDCKESMAKALNLKPAEMEAMPLSDQAARLFKYCAVNRISLDSVIMQLAK